jgi:thiol-disulfide isomerase/thioredoxin
MRSFVRRQLAGAAVVLLATAPLAAQESGIAIGTQAPNAAMESLDGKPADLSPYLGKGPVLIQFWATWCGNCKALEPAMQAAQKKYAGQVRFIAVAVSVNQSLDRIKAYKERHQMTQDIFYDRKGNATDAYEVPATSFVVVVDAKGKVVYTGVGSDQDIDAAIRKAM